MSRYQLLHGDCLEVMKGMADNSVDAVVCDPPAGIAFMNKGWDKDKGGRKEWIDWMEAVAAECYRVIKPGGHAFVWAIPRTSHWTGMAWESAGWIPRDKVYHIFGSGFPKSRDISKAIDKEAVVACPQCRGSGKQLFTEAFDEWIAKTGPFGGTRGEWEQLKRGVACERCHGSGRVKGAEREVLGPNRFEGINGKANANCYGTASRPESTAPSTQAAKDWQGWGTALKPAVEEWWLFRKPLSEKTVAANVLRWGTGAINVDGCRVAHDEECRMMAPSQANIERPSEKHRQAGRRNAVLELKPQGRWPANVVHSGEDCVVGLFPSQAGAHGGKKVGRSAQSNILSFGGGSEYSVNGYGDKGSAARFFKECKADEPPADKGRWPANVCHDGSEEVVGLFPESNGGQARQGHPGGATFGGGEMGEDVVGTWYGDSGSAARYFYCAKASKKDRDEGCEGLEERDGASTSNGGKPGKVMTVGSASLSGEPTAPPKARNNHPTVKPFALMKYLCRLVTPPSGVILDPFMGSGSTGKAAIAEGFQFIGIELDADYMQIAEARIKHAQEQKK